MILLQKLLRIARNWINYLRDSAFMLRWILRCRLLRQSRTLVFGRVWMHHANRSGYHLALARFPYVVPDNLLKSLPFPLSRIERTTGIPIRAFHLACFVRLAGCNRFVFVDGDYHLALIRDIQRIGKLRGIAIFHQPPEVIRKLVPGERFLSGAVCLSRHQLEHVMHLSPPGKTLVVPLGVDVSYFVPEPGPPTQRSRCVLAVGSHRRDFGLLDAVAGRLALSHPEVVVKLLAPPQEDHVFQFVQHLPRASDAEYLRIFQEATVFLLPLKLSAANCSLLEAMACALPIVVTSTPGTREYAGDCVLYGDLGDVESHFEGVRRLLDDPGLAAAIGTRARKVAVQFDFDAVSGDLSNAIARLA